MVYKKTILSLASLVLVLGGGVLATNAFGGNWGGRFGANDDATAAIAANDYNAWVEAVGGADEYPASEVTSDEFPTLIQAHNLETAARNQLDEARELRESIGLNQGFGGPHMGGPMMGGDPEHREAVEAAIESGDYGAFISALGDSPRADEITEEQFNTLVEARALMLAGDIEGARAFQKEAGLPFRMGNKGTHNGFGRSPNQ